MEHNQFEHNELDHNELQDRQLAEFESRLRQAMQRREAPIGLRQRVLARARERRQARHSRWWMLQRLTASLLLAAAVGGFAAWRHHQEEERKGEAAREQVLTAFRIANRTLDRVNTRLSDTRPSEDSR